MVHFVIGTGNLPVFNVNPQGTDSARSPAQYTDVTHLQIHKQRLLGAEHREDHTPGHSAVVPDIGRALGSRHIRTTAGPVG